MSGSSIFGFDPISGIWPSGNWLAGVSVAGAWPYWTAGVAAACFVVFAVISFRRASSTGIFPMALRYSVILVGALMVLTFLDRATMRDRNAERRALEARSVELTAHAVMPGSALACLDSGAGDEVERACEKALFANPETVASAVSYVAARFALLGDGLDYAQHDGAYAAMLHGSRKVLEMDRFGFLAHVLTTRDGCTPDNCVALKRLGDASRVQANMRERTYAVQVARYEPTWTGKPASAPADDKPTASLPGNTTTSLASANGEVPPAKSTLPNIDFPSASSIPAVNIMNTEGAAPSAAAPSLPPPAAAPGIASAPAPKPAAAAVPSPPRRPPPPARRAAPAAAPAAAEQPGAPVQITPFDSAGQAAAAAAAR